MKATAIYIESISGLPVTEQAELLALFKLGQTSHSFNVALKGCLKQKPEYIAGMLSEKSNLASCLSKGLKRYARQS